MAIDGEVVKILRKQAGLRVKDIALAAGRSESYIRDIEAGTRLLKKGAETIEAIAAKLGVPARTITRGD